MNGRCTADPLDHADDVCEFCGDEYCSTCLLRTRNGKGPLVCRECAILNSGVKGSRPNKPRLSKAQVQRARTRLRDHAKDRSDSGFRYFDEDADWVEPSVGEVQAEGDDDATIAQETPKPPRLRFKLRSKSESKTESGDLMTDDPIRTGDELEPVPPAPVVHDIIESVAPPPLDDEATPPAAPIVPDTLAARVPASDVSDLPLPPVSSNEPSIPAADASSPSSSPLAERVRDVGPASIPASLEIDPFSLDHDPFESYEPELQTVDHPTGPWAFPATAPVSDAAPSGFEWNRSETAEPETLEARMVGEVPVPFPSNHDPFAPTMNPTTQPSATPPPAYVPPPQPAPLPQRAAPQPAVAMASPPQGTSGSTIEAGVRPSADVDANGSWVPPMLRGMAPVEERRAEALPRRRRSD